MAKSKPRKPMGQRGKLSELLDREFNSGMIGGWNAFSMAFFITFLNVNVNFDFVPEEKQHEFCVAMEDEMIRIFKEELHGDPSNYELLIGNAERAREILELTQEDLWNWNK